MATGRALEPMGRRRKTSRVGTIATYWRVILLGVALVVTFLNLHSVLNKQVTRHLHPAGIVAYVSNDPLHLTQCLMHRQVRARFYLGTV